MPYFYFVCPKVEGVVNVLYIETSINRFISICFPVFSLVTNQQMRNVLNLISGVIVDMDIVLFNRCTKHSYRCFMYISTHQEYNCLLNFTEVFGLFNRN